MKNLHHSHIPSDIKERLQSGHPTSYLKDIIYGGVDGTITTFAIVSGVAGANLAAKIVLILGLANLIADGFSMAMSNYLAYKAETDHHNLIEKYEREQIHTNPKGEIEEVRQILALKGFSGPILEEATSIFIKDKKRWVDFMLGEEYGITKNRQIPIKAAAATFSAFCFFGAFPLLPYFFSLSNAYLYSCILTSTCFFGIGSFKSKWGLSSWWISGAQTLILGSVAATLAYYIGYFLKTI